MLKQYVIDDINNLIRNSVSADFTNTLIQPKLSASTAKKPLDKLEKRYTELNTIINKIMEQCALGVIDDATFARMYKNYKDEQNELAKKITDLETEQRKVTENENNSKLFAESIHKYTQPITTLSREVLLDLVDKIVVYEPVGERWSRNKQHKFEIHYKHVGYLQR
jgi:6-phosphogluconate dehydrogenase